MAQEIGYDGRVKVSNRVISTVFGVVAGLFLCATMASAQINAAPPSVTSLGFGGRAINGAPPSVTSLGPRGYTPGFNPAFPNSRTLFGYSYPHHHRHYNGYAPLGTSVYAVPVYGYTDAYPDAAYPDQPDDPQNPAANAVSPEDQYNGGPTIFDRRGPGTAAYHSLSGGAEYPGYGTPQVQYNGEPAIFDPRGPANAAPQSASPQNEQMQAFAAPAVPDPPPTAQPKTVLVFKDGHQQEVENYAIVGDTLWDLTGDRRHKIALSDLNLHATAKANDDRGVDFELPPGSM